MQAVKNKYRGIDNTTFRRWMFTVAGAFICFLASLYVMFNVPADGYEYLFALPAVNALLIVIFKRVFFNPFQRIGVWAMNSITFIRLVILPVLMSYTGSIETQGYVNPSVSARSQAIWLTIYEVVVIYIILYFFTRKYNMDNRKIDIPDDPQVLVDDGNENILLLTTIAGFAVLFVILPGAFSGITVFSKTVSITSSTLEYRGQLILTGLKYVAISVLLYRCYRKYIMTKRNMYVYISFFLVVLSIGVVTVTVRNYFLLSIIIGIYVMWMFYKKHINVFVFAIVLIIIVSFVGTVFITLTLRTREFEGNIITSVIGENLKETQIILQSYFSGVSGVAHSIDMCNYFSELSRLETLKYELSNTFFPLSFIYKRFMSVDARYRIDYLFNFISFGEYNHLSLITPMIGQGIYFFGPALSPLFSAICTVLLGIIEKLRFESKSYKNYYILAMFSISMGVMGMYSFSILLRTITHTIIPAAGVIMFARILKKVWNDYRSGSVVYRG